MSLFDYAKHKFHIGEDHGNVPLGLHPGTRIEIKDVTLVLAESAGSIVKDIKKSSVIESLGFYTQGDMRVFRAYFDDENCFVEVPVKLSEPEKPIHIRIFKTLNEDFPDPELRNLLLGNEPLIGWIQFQINKPIEAVYNRSWMLGSSPANSVQPYNLFETLMDKSKKEIQHDEHSIMLYQRNLPENITEYLYADFVNQKRPDGQESEVFRTFIGIEISQGEIDIFPAIGV